MLAVVALGIFMGKYMFKLMEATSSQTLSSNTTTPQVEGQSKVKILYGDKEEISPSVLATDSSQANQAAQQQPNVLFAEQKVTTTEKNAPSQSSLATKNAPPASNETSPKNSLAFSPNGPRWYAFSTTKGLNVREAPDRKGKFLFKVAKGTRGVVKEKKAGWTYIKWDFNKKSGWSIDEYLVQGPAIIFESAINKPSSSKSENLKAEQINQLSIEKTIEANKTIVGIAKPAPASETVITYTNGKDLPKRGTISSQGGANIRKKPTTKSARLIRLPKGTVVGIKSVQKIDSYQWFEITYKNGTQTGWTREDNIQF